MSKKLKIASFISSGKGTTMEQIGIASKKGEIPVDLVCVISSSPKSGGIKRAKKLGIDVVILNPGQFRTKDNKTNWDTFGKAIIKELKKRKVDVFLQNGWLIKTPKIVINEFKGYNQHPGPLPDFGGQGMFGIRVHEAVIKFGLPWTEAVIQRVYNEIDAGPVVKSQKIKIPKGSTAESLRTLVLPIEHKIMKEFLIELANGNITEEFRESVVAPEDKRRLEWAKQKAIKLHP